VHRKSGIEGQDVINPTCKEAPARGRGFLFSHMANADLYCKSSTVTWNSAHANVHSRVVLMRLVIAWLIAVAVAAVFTYPARAEILITVDKNTQRMSVVRDGQSLYNWPVSTGRKGYATPSGSFTAFRMEADHHSDEWDDAPMPHSIFFTKIGHAIHGTFDTKNLGKPASHGCVRLSPANAATLFALVEREGVTKTKVALTGGEQVALARRGADTPRSHADENDSRLPNPFNSTPEYPRQDYAQPRYVDPNYGYSRPQYVQPQYGQPINRYPPSYDAN
jgi:L,D-transpeptidase catalytic domain